MKTIEARLFASLQRLFDNDGEAIIEALAYGSDSGEHTPQKCAFLVDAAEFVAGPESMLRASMLSLQAGLVYRNDQRRRLLLEAMKIAKRQVPTSIFACYEYFALEYVAALISDAESAEAGRVLCEVLDRMTASPTINNKHVAMLVFDGDVCTPANAAALRAVGCYDEATLLDAFDAKITNVRRPEFIELWSAFAQEWRETAKCCARGWKVGRKPKAS